MSARSLPENGLGMQARAALTDRRKAMPLHESFGLCILMSALGQQRFWPRGSALWPPCCSFNYPGKLRRLIVNKTTKKAREEILDDGNNKFPVVDQRVHCHEYRDVYYIQARRVDALAC
jgi:hypothetical protein